MNGKSPSELAAEHGLTLDDARDIITLYFHETWPHVAAYNAFVERLATSRTKLELKGEILAVKEPVVRRLLKISSPMFAGAGAPAIDGELWPDNLTAERRAVARDRLTVLLQCRSTGEAKGLWFEYLAIHLGGRHGNMLANAEASLSPSD